MHLLRNVSVAVENKASCVGVGPHILENQPVVHLNTLHFCRGDTANLIESIAGRAENRCGDFLKIFFIIRSRIKSGGKTYGLRLIVVINYVIERAINSVIDVQSLGLAAPTLARVDLSGNCGACAHKVASRLCNKPEIARWIRVSIDFGPELINGLTHGKSEFLEGWHVWAAVASFVSGESATDIDHGHRAHANFVSISKNLGCVFKGS